MIFNCTSVFHMLIIMTIVYRLRQAGKEARVTIIIPEHVINCVKKVPLLNKIDLVDKAIIVNNSNISDCLERLGDSNPTEIFLGGMDYTAIALYEFGKSRNLVINLFEENAALINDIERYSAFLEELNPQICEVFSFKKLDRLWRLEGEIIPSDQYNNIEVVNIGMNELFSSIEYKEWIAPYLDMLFNDISAIRIPRTIFFDTYALAVARRCSRETEVEILEALVGIISKWDYEIKPHPSDNPEWKYRDNYKIFDCQDVPIDVIKLRNSDTKAEKGIFISYGITGCVTNELYLRKNQINIIFLYKILRLYGIDYPGEMLVDELYENCDEEQRACMYFPKTFAELDYILRSLNGEETISADDFKELESTEINNAILKTATRLTKVSGQIPDDYNLGRLQYEESEGVWKELSECRYIMHNGIRQFTFDIKTSDTLRIQSNNIKMRWGIVSGICIAIKDVRIRAINSAGNQTYEVGEELIQYCDEYKNGEYIRFNNCDPVIDFAIDRRQLIESSSIEIEADIRFDASYQSILELRAANCTSMTETINSLVEGCQARDKNIEEVNGYLSDWVRIANEREETIEQLKMQVGSNTISKTENERLKEELQSLKARFISAEMENAELKNRIDMINREREKDKQILASSKEYIKYKLKGRE